MAFECEFDGFKIVAIKRPSEDVLLKLSAGMRSARAQVSEALVTTQRVLNLWQQASRMGLGSADCSNTLMDQFRMHLCIHFRLERSVDIVVFLRELNERLQKLAKGMASPKLRLAEFGYHWFAPAEAKAYVKMPTEWMLR
ncbi:MAG: hypothetical protein AAF334_06105, partial [Pseudomonadota bacterium]